MDEVAEIKKVYHDANEFLVRLANVWENGLLYSARGDGATALGLSAWLLSGLDEGVRLGDAVKLVCALTVLVEDNTCWHAMRDGTRALRMGAELINSLSNSPGVAGRTYIQIRDDLICWSDHIEMNVFPYGNNGPGALRLAANLLQLTKCLV
jgi:hypothetical protein